jgi:hypothetical protein
MTTLDSSMKGDGGTVPIACTLTSAALAAQASRWELLAGRAMTERAETAHGLRLSFRPEPGADEELRTLVAMEEQCCAWADWTVETRAGRSSSTSTPPETASPPCTECSPACTRPGHLTRFNQLMTPGNSNQLASTSGHADQLTPAPSQRPRRCH